MNSSSGIKRGLATVAVSALAVSGLAGFAGTAHAVSIDDQQAASADVNFYTQDGVGASTANDGANTTVSLVAGASADVKKVRFTYSIGGGAAQEIAVVDRVNGAFSTQWAPPQNVLGGNVELKAIGLDAAGNPIATAEDTNSNVAVAGATKAIAIAAAPGSEVGAYDTPGGTTKVIVSGTTDAAAAGDVSLNGVELGQANNSGIKNFSGVQDLGNYTWDSTAPIVDEAVLHAATNDSDDAVPVKLYKQTIAASGVSVDAPAKAAGNSNVTVSVTDQQGKPVAGALVYLDGAGAAVQSNAKGQATFAGVTPAAHSIHVDVNGSGATFEPGVDIQKSFTIAAYTPALTTLTTTAAKPVLDRDEITNATFKVVAKDQEGATMTGALPATMRGTWTLVPFDGTADLTAPASINLATGEVTGIPTAKSGTATLNVRNEIDGDPQPSNGDVQAAALTVKVGEASIKWDAANNNVQAAAGTSVVVNGSITLEDGTALADRQANVTLVTGGDAAFAPTASQPQGTVVTAGVATVTTKADGTFAVKVTDPAVVAPAVQPKELNVILDAESAGLGITFANTANLDLDFQDLAVDKTTFTNTNLFDGKATPGRPVEFTGTVVNAAGDPVSNTAVDLSLDKGFFVQTDNNGLVPDVAPAEGGLWGDWASAGATKTVTTDANGQFTVTVGIEKDVDFDDDGAADVTLSATVGGKTNTTTKTFSSSDALNVGDVTIEFADQQDVRVLPKAPTSHDVYLDVFATDQFGNLTDADVELKDNKADARIEGSNGTAVVTAKFTDQGSNAWLDSATAGDQAVSGHVVNGDKNTWNDTTPAPAPARTWVRLDGPNNAVSAESGATTTEWYVVDLEAGSYTLSHNGAEWNAVGKVVTVTYTAKDQNGNPLDDIDVEFFRTGPTDNPLDGLFGNANGNTNADGEVKVTFQGKGAGTAIITTVAEDGNTGDVIAAGEQTLEIKFGTEPVEPTEPSAVTAKLAGEHNGAKKDKLKVTTSPAAKGAVVTLQRLNAKGKWKAVDSKVINKKGKKSFKVADLNGKKKTAYRVVVKATATTKAATSNTKKVK
ncbi:Ig-like domain-containing protein [Nocardioides daejeonensis]|uniref:Ig-like domain-containing protein n=1 Tax=Nocardioides daejeonensis TaxID=1046556 RepID=UPI000D747D27|nr:Ig-like domain-containing protein [Nocardioides daejeonensis]